MDRIGRTAREVFGYEQLRPGQHEAVEAVVEGRDVLAVMSTGYGKSAIYQIAALLIPGPTVVVSPLLALQQDQIEDLDAQATGGAAGVNSLVSEGERRRRSTISTRTSSSSSSSRRSSSRTRRCSARWRPPSRRCSWSTRRTASASGATTSGPTT